MKKFFVVAAFAALIPVSVLAQTAGQLSKDATNWTGFYAGFNAGGTVSSSNAQTSTVYSTTGWFAPSSPPAIAIAGNQNLSPQGYVLGGQFGYNRQIAPRWVLGAEADFGAFEASDSASRTAVYPCCSPYTFTVAQSVSTTWLATIRPRVGYAVTGRSLLFISGGAAKTQLNYSSLFTDDESNNNESASVAMLKTGWVLGGGWEYALNRYLSARAEYLYADFGSVSSAGTVMTSNYTPIIGTVRT
ncbi:MAG: outer membrane beta-barrel protein, partial [Terracidiphilus sp.]